MKRERKIGSGTAVVSILLAVLTAHVSAQDQKEIHLPPQSRMAIAAENPADPMSPDSVTPNLKSEDKALSYSLIGTLLPTASLILMGPGLIVGPSIGYFYAGMPGRAWTGIGIRVIGVGGMISSFAICGWDCGPGQSAYNVAWAVFLSSAGIMVSSAVYDIATVKAAVREHNATLGGLGETIAPVYFADTGALGVKLTYRF